MHAAAVFGKIALLNTSATDAAEYSPKSKGKRYELRLRKIFNGTAWDLAKTLNIFELNLLWFDVLATCMGYVSIPKLELNHGFSSEGSGQSRRPSNLLVVPDVPGTCLNFSSHNKYN